MNSCGTSYNRVRKPGRRLDQFVIPNNSDFYSVPSDFEQDIRICHNDDIVRGIYLEQSQKSHVYAKQHENLEDIINTCNHEALHHAFMLAYNGEFGAEGIDMDVYQEHWAIRKVAWLLQDCISDENLEQCNEALREEDY